MCALCSTDCHLNDLISRRIAADTSQAGTTSPCCHTLSLFPCLCSPPLATYTSPLIPHSLLPEIAGYTTIIFARPTPPPLFFRHAVTCPAVYFDVAVPHPSLRNKYPSYLPTLNNYRRTGVIPVRSRKTQEKKILFFTSTLSRIYAIREGEGGRS